MINITPSSNIDYKNVRYTPIDHTTVRLDFADGSTTYDDIANLRRHRPVLSNRSDPKNILSQISRDEASQMAYEMHRLVSMDKDSYSTFYDQLGRFINLCGYSMSDDGDLSPLMEQGQNINVKSTALSRTLLHFVNSITSQLLPLSGLADTVIDGPHTKQEEIKADNVKKFVNRHFDVTHKDFREETTRAVKWAAIAGYGVKKTYMDPITEEPVSRFINIRDFIIHYNNISASTSQRKTHVIRMSQRDYKINVLNGYYIDGAESLYPDDGGIDTADAIEEAKKLMMGVDVGQLDGEMANKIYELWEIECDYKLKTFDPIKGIEIPLTYILTIDSKSRKPIRLVTNFNLNAPLKKLPSPYTIYSFAPAIAGLGLGLIHLCTAPAQTATQLLKTLIEAGEFSTRPAGFISNALQLSSTDLKPAIPGIYQVVKAAGSFSDHIHDINSNEPSPVLQQIFQQMESSITELATLTVDQVTQLADQAAVTMLSLVNEIQRTPNAILQRFYVSMREELEKFQYLFYEWLAPMTVPYTFMSSHGVVSVQKDDFCLDPQTINPQTGQPQAIIRIVPAADPSMKNSTYRLLESNVVLNYATQFPQIFNMRETMLYALSNMGMDDQLAESLMIPQPTPPPPPPAVDPITENQNLMTGKPVQAYIFQDQAAYIAVNSLLLNYPDPQVVANTQALIHSRYALMFLQQFQMKTGMQIPQDPSQLTPDLQNQIAIYASQMAQQGQLQNPASQPQQGPDPSILLEQQKMENEMELAHLKNQTEMMKIESQKEIALIKEQSEQRKLEQKMESDRVAMAIEKERSDREKEIQHVKLALEELKIRHQEQRENDKLELDRLTSIIPILREEKDRKEQRIEPDSMSVSS